MWGVISGVEQSSPRQEVPLCIDQPLQNGSSALIVGDFKLLLGPQQLSYWQGPEFPNGSDTEAYGRWPTIPYNMLPRSEWAYRLSVSVEYYLSIYLSLQPCLLLRQSKGPGFSIRV